MPKLKVPNSGGNPPGEGSGTAILEPVHKAKLRRASSECDGESITAISTHGSQTKLLRRASNGLNDMLTFSDVFGELECEVRCLKCLIEASHPRLFSIPPQSNAFKGFVRNGVLAEYASLNEALMEEHERSEKTGEGGTESVGRVDMDDTAQGRVARWALFGVNAAVEEGVVNCVYIRSYIPLYKFTASRIYADSQPYLLHILVY